MKISAGFLLVLFAAASPELQYFRYQRPVTAPASTQSCLVLDPGIFAHAAPQLADLRLYRDGTETPYVVRMAAPVENAAKSIAPLNLGMRGGQVAFDAAMPEGKFSDVELAISAQDFIATVSVTGSQSQGNTTETKLGSYTIFDLTRQRLGRSTVLHLPESDFRYLHFRIGGPLKPETITGISTMRSSVSKPKYATVAETSQATQKGHATVIEFAVPANVPIDRVIFTPGASPTNFSRDVTVSVASLSKPATSDGAEPAPYTIASENLLRIHSAQNGHRIDEERLEIDVRETAQTSPSKWTIRIDNGDDAPITLTSIQLQMLERTLCFDPLPQAKYALYYGDPALNAPQYDYARLFALDANAAIATSGPEAQNPQFQPRPDERPFTEKHPALLWIALIAVIALLGAIALRSAKKVSPTP